MECLRRREKEEEDKKWLQQVHNGIAALQFYLSAIVASGLHVSNNEDVDGECTDMFRGGGGMMLKKTTKKKKKCNRTSARTYNNE